MDDELERLREEKRDRLRERAERQQRRASAPDEPVAVTGPDHLNTIIERQPVVLVDFHADWCGPCQMLAPTVDRLAAETDATVAKVDTDAHPRLAQEHGVRGLPTLVLFVDGEPADRLVGMQSESTLRSLIERESRPEHS